jgi:hypothetical protein
MWKQKLQHPSTIETYLEPSIFFISDVRVLALSTTLFIWDQKRTFSYIKGIHLYQIVISCFFDS